MTSRPLDPSEVYYEIVDRSWPMNSLGYVELSESHDTSRVAAAWAELGDRIPVMGARLERTGPREARFVFDTDLPPGPVTTRDSLPAALAAESAHRFRPGEPQVRCSVVEGADSTGIVLCAHHAALDGRPLAQLTLLLARLLVDGEQVGDHPLTAPTDPLGRYTLPERDWSTRRTEMLTLAREVRGEESYVGHGTPPSWHDASLDRDRAVTFTIVDLSAEESRQLMAWAKDNGATVHGALTVGILHTVARLAPELTRIPFSTTVDLRARCAPGAGDHVGQAAAVVMSAFDVTRDAADLARQASADVRRRVERGEAEMFFALSGVGKLPVGEASDQVVRRWMEAATPTVNLSNVGMVTGEAPAAVRRLGMGLAPTPNQVVFVAATTFRGRANFTVAIDRNRLDVDPETFTSTLHACLTDLGREDPVP